jgi:hypothetical protein
MRGASSALRQRQRHRQQHLLQRQCGRRAHARAEAGGVNRLRRRDPCVYAREGREQVLAGDPPYGWLLLPPGVRPR